MNFGGPRGGCRLEQAFARLAGFALRCTLGGVFVWFGWPKLLPGLSPAEPLVLMTTQKLTFGLVTGDAARIAVGLLELAIGVMLFIGRLPRLTVVVLLAHMAGAAAPLLLFPDLTWRAPGVGTLEGQYILKNAVIVAAALTLLGHRRQASACPARQRS
ncbi:DoxX family membrane protein [Kitasatospora sp. NPDC008050]|uniref:DoxX family membrane protein n=1 Tax=Kitasatospora sp. NPDC008050 TaxID=3364021 RepID=UPI0036E935B2